MKHLLLIVFVLALSACAPSSTHKPFIIKLLTVPDSIYKNGYMDSLYVVAKERMSKEMIDNVHANYRNGFVISETRKGKYQYDERGFKEYVDCEDIRIRPLDTTGCKNASILIAFYLSSVDGKWHLQRMINGYFIEGPPD